MLFKEDLKKAILWQYQEAVGLIGLVEIMQRGYDVLHAGFWRTWYDDVFNVDTATSFGLHLWMRILGIDATQIQGEIETESHAFGFRWNFRKPVNFAPAPLRLSRVYRDLKRDLIKLRYFSLTMPITTENVARIVDYIFGKRGDFELTESPQEIGMHMHVPTDPEHMDYYSALADNEHLFRHAFPRPAGVYFAFTWD